MFALLWMALALVSAFYGFATAIAQDVQNLDAFHVRPTANGVIYAGDGHTVLAILRSRDQNRKLVTSDQIAKVMKNATVAIEDKRFYEHGAIDPIGLARAAAVDLMTGRTQGGSTITQQFVKNVYTKGQRTLQRKLVEAVLAAQVEGAWSKDHILTEYLNTVYFGNHAYGVEEAAQIYFGVHAKKLRLYQAALLAGIVRSPTAYDPVLHPVAATKRRNEVLAAMLQQKLISPLAYATAVNTALIPYGHKVAPARGVARHRRLLHAVRRAPADRALRRGADVRRRAQGLHDDRPEDAEAGAPRAQHHAQEEGPGGSDGRHRPAQRAGQGARRRARLLEAALRRRDPGPAAARLVVQAVRARRGARGGHPALDDVPVEAPGDQPRRRPSLGRAQRHARSTTAGSRSRPRRRSRTTPSTPS